MARKRTTAKKRPTRSTAARRKTTSRRKKGSDKLVNLFVPLFLMVCIVGCLGLVLFIGFRSVAASSFFEIENVETVGLKNVAKNEIDKAVKAGMQGRGVFQADLDKIREYVEAIDYVHHVSVSRLLPGTIRVIVNERVPVALVRHGGKIYRADSEGVLLEVVKKRKPNDPKFVLLKWEKSDGDPKNVKDNARKLALYLELAEEWKKFDLVDRVMAVDLDDPDRAEAFILDSGSSVTIVLGSEDYGKRLKDGIKHTAGQGKRIAQISLDKPNSPVIEFRQGSK